MNCMLVGARDRYILIDAGLMFPDFTVCPPSMPPKAYTIGEQPKNNLHDNYGSIQLDACGSAHQIRGSCRH